MHTGSLVEKPEGRRLIGRPRGRRKNNIKIDFRVVWGCVLDRCGSG